MSELEQMTKEELLEEYKDLLDDNAWWNRRWKAENHRANNLQQRINKAIEIIKLCDTKCARELLEILGDKE